MRSFSIKWFWPKKMTNKQVFIRLAIVVAIITAVVRISGSLITDWKQKQKVNYWLNKAWQDSNSTTTFDDASQWLTDNRFDVVIWNPHQDRGWIGRESEYKKDEQVTYYIVQGSRLLTEDSLLFNPSWMDLEFRFDPEGRFQDVKFIIREYPQPD